MQGTFSSDEFDLEGLSHSVCKTLERPYRRVSVSLAVKQHFKLLHFVPSSVYVIPHISVNVNSAMKKLPLRRSREGEYQTL